MAGLFLSRDDTQCARRLAIAREQFASHGFSGPREVAIEDWRLLHFDWVIGGPASFHADGEDFVAVAGTLTYRGTTGRAALAALLADVRLPTLPWDELGGHFTAVIRKDGRSVVYADWFAAFQLFHDTDHRFFSTSFLAATRAMTAPRFDPQGVYEYAFNVVPIGDDTVIDGLKTLGPGLAIELTGDGIVSHRSPRTLPAQNERLPIADRIAAHRDVLLETVRAHAAKFGGHITCPLSGGIDSRLLYASFRAVGAAPHLYVYGPEGSVDVAIAQTIGAGEGVAVDWVNKARMRSVEPDAFVAQVNRNFEEFDALPTYGNLFDNGANAAARDLRHAGGALASSGGCGEIYRDFFFLPNRRLSALAVARTFFARFVASDATAIFDPRGFLDRIADKIAAAIDVDDRRRAIPRGLIEQIYPRVRCRSLFGREISLEGRYSPYLMPFLDNRVVAEAMRLPIALKQAGRFESMLLAAIDPKLAAYPSAYGHHFAGPPNGRHRFEEWSSRVRPPWLRQRTYAMRRRLRPMADEHGGLLSPDYMGRVIDLDMPIMRRFFQIDRITDSGLWRRLAALEYTAERLGIS